MATFIGAVCGVLAVFPMLYVLAMCVMRDSPFEFRVVLSCAIVPFVVLMVLALAINFWFHEAAIEFGKASALAFLISTVVAVLLVRPWQR